MLHKKHLMAKMTITTMMIMTMMIMTMVTMMTMIDDDNDKYVKYQEN